LAPRPTPQNSTALPTFVIRALDTKVDMPADLTCQKSLRSNQCCGVAELIVASPTTVKRRDQYHRWRAIRPPRQPIDRRREHTCGQVEPTKEMLASGLGSSLAPAFFFWYQLIMAKSTITGSSKKKRGRPSLYEGGDGKGAPQIGLRLPPPELAAVDAWIVKQPKPRPSRPVAIRRLVAIGLKAKPLSNERVRLGLSLDLGTMGKIEPDSAKTTRLARARELAAEVIDKMGDPTAHSDERAQRRQRLTKGPLEFREVRVDRAKGKAK
jgi:hypothetical protein